jgi:hypothetical protein
MPANEMRRNADLATLAHHNVPRMIHRQWARLSVLLLTIEVTVSAQHWPQFRGGQGGVAADDPSLPDTWTETENVAWKRDIPGRGWSSPVVWGDHLFITTAINLRNPKQTLLGPRSVPWCEHGRDDEPEGPGKGH